MTSFNTLQSISSRLTELSTQLSTSKLSKEELDEFESLSRKLYERALILNYKAKEENVYGKYSGKVPNPILPFENEEVVEETTEVVVEEVIETVVETEPEPEVIVPQEETVVEKSSAKKEKAEPLFEGLFGGLDERVQFDFSGGFETPKAEGNPAVETEPITPVEETEEEAPVTVQAVEKHQELEESISEEEELEEESKEEIIEEPIAKMEEPIIEEKPSPSLNELLQGGHSGLNDKSDSFYDRFSKSYRAAIGDKLGTSKITTLKGAVGLNDRLLFINELFGGDSSAYNESIEILDDFENSELALRKLSEIAAKHNWNKEDASVDEFAHLITRRYVD